MGKPDGFLKTARATAKARDPEDRQADWDELSPRLADGALQQQAARCMDCGIPFCRGPHPGPERPGGGCPISNKIPEWNHRVYVGDWRGAYERLVATNNFPEFTGRVCPAPCEGSCVLGIGAPESAVAIKGVERAIVDRAFEQGWVVPRPPTRRTGRQVAVVGSGPAGLACADQLNRAGHRVTVFERADRIGGLLRYGIPPMKLPADVVQRRVDLLAAEGIAFRPGVSVGVDYPVGRLQAEHDAVVLCIGATKPRDLEIEGRDLDGIHFAMDYLEPAQRVLEDGEGPFLDAKDRDVIVIGGGDTGTDCVATALRHGCRSITQFEILPRPPDDRADVNPWPQWPRIYRLDYGQTEASARFGDDPRRYLMLTRAFYGDEGGRVQGLETVRLDAGGMPQPGTETRFDTDLVLLALGFTGPRVELLEQLGVARDERTNVRATTTGDDAYATSVAGIFTAGDARRGQSLIVWAIREGRGAARAVDRYLMGDSSLP